jgi:hypothetical protein
VPATLHQYEVEQNDEWKIDCSTSDSEVELVEI